MLPHRITAAALTCALALLSAPVGAITAAQAARPASLPPEGYQSSTWVDSRGCAYFRGQNGQWVAAVSGDGRPVCGGKTALGRVSPLTGYPVPPGYRVAWTDGRLNPLRGPRGN